MAARATSPTPGTAVVNLAAWRAWLADELASASAANEAAATAAVSEVLSTLDASRESLALIRAMQEVNVPRFLSEDLPLFHAIVDYQPASGWGFDLDGGAVVAGAPTIIDRIGTPLSIRFMLQRPPSDGAAELRVTATSECDALDAPFLRRTLAAVEDVRVRITEDRVGPLTTFDVLVVKHLGPPCSARWAGLQPRAWPRPATGAREM